MGTLSDSEGREEEISRVFAKILEFQGIAASGGPRDRFFANRNSRPLLRCSRDSNLPRVSTQCENDYRL